MTISSRPRTSWTRHGLALVLLAGLDGFLRFRQHLNRTFLRGASIVLALGLLAMAISSLFALARITRNVESLVGDSLVGVESSIAMRSTVREVQLKLLRQSQTEVPRVTATEIRAFEEAMAEQLRIYHAGVYVLEDEVNVRRIELQLDTYVEALNRLANRVQPDPAQLSAADSLATELVSRIDHAYQFNRDHTRRNASDAAESARFALVIFKRVSWGFAALALAAAALYVFYRWIAPPDSNDA